MIRTFIDYLSVSPEIKSISEKIISFQRISPDEGLTLYREAPLSLLSSLSDFVRRKKNHDDTFYIKNAHIEPTNICIYQCRFCSYSRKEGEEGSWEYSIEEMVAMAKAASDKGVSELHIVGGVHPERDLYFYASLIKEIASVAKNCHIKAFTAAELDHMFNKSGVNPEKGFQILKDAGLNSIPGGGAEIFSEEIRKKICENKISGEQWLQIHETAHKCGIPSNATMLYGHVEKFSHRIDHLQKLRELQDRTGMFNAFIPLKYRNKNNLLSELPEVSLIEDLRNFAVCRIYLDNFNHIKAYWPMLGKESTQLSLSFGVDDIDGTIEDSTRIYSMAGVEDAPSLMSATELKNLITAAHRKAVERDSLYNHL